MPRGPGKKENYNLDYSRFSGDFDEDGAVALKVQDEQPDELQDEFRNMLRQVPPELQEAFRLMQVAKATGDEKAQTRAQELALQSVEKGGPEAKQRFLDEVNKQMPEARDEAARRIGVEPNAPVKSGISQVEDQLRKGQKEMQRQMEDLKKHEEEISRLTCPEEFFAFMQRGGMGQEDLQRMFQGDQKHTEECMSRMLDQVQKPSDKVKTETEQAAKIADQIETILGGRNLDLEDPAEPEAEAAPAAPEPPAVEIPQHRLQYRKDAAGRYESVELRVELPGVEDMGAVQLDVGEKYLRLVTADPAPLFAVNVGPFPVLVDAQAARAKFSKKRQELTVTVPAA